MIRRAWTWFWGTDVGRYSLNWLLALDQLYNATLGGHHDETRSSRLGRRKLEALAGGRPLSWSERALDAVLDWLDPGHSVDAIEWSEEAVQAWLRDHPHARFRLARCGKVVGVSA